jgi:hypothetical protein
MRLTLFLHTLVNGLLLDFLHQEGISSKSSKETKNLKKVINFMEVSQIRKHSQSKWKGKIEMLKRTYREFFKSPISPRKMQQNPEGISSLPNAFGKRKQGSKTQRAEWEALKLMDIKVQLRLSKEAKANLLSKQIYQSR